MFAAPAASELRWLHCGSFVLDSEETGRPMVRCSTSVDITIPIRHGDRNKSYFESVSQNSFEISVKSV